MESSSEPKEKPAFTAYFERAWSQALLAVSTAEDEAARLVTKVAEVAGWGQDEVKRQARELTERLASQRRDLERGVEEGVRRALSAVAFPKREDLNEVSARIDALSRRIDALVENR